MLINLSERESRVRILLGTAFVTIGSHTLWYVLIPLGLMLLKTGITSKCSITHRFFGTSSKAIENRYLKFLPKYNPQPVLIFQANGELAFANKIARQTFPDVDQLRQLISCSIEGVIENESTHSCKLTRDSGEVYSLVYRGSKQLDGLFVYVTEITEIVALNLEIIETQKEIVYAMGEIGESRSQETGDHVRRVAEYSELLARLSGLGSDEAELIKLASPMHDIGKVGIPDAVLKKPAKLDREEFEIMKTHAEIGYDLLKYSSRPILKTAAIISYQHHEKWNGQGYPQGLSGDDIHLYGRITAVADVFDALGSERVYKKAWPMEKIMALFKQERGEHFDPRLVDLLSENLARFLEIRAKYPN